MADEISKLDAFESERYRVDIWHGYLLRSLDSLVIPLIKAGEIDRAVLDDPKFFSIRFAHPGGDMMVSNLYAIKLEPGEFAVIDLHRSRLSFISSSKEKGSETDATMRARISENADFASLKNFEYNDLEFVFKEQKRFHWSLKPEFEPIGMESRSGELVFKPKDSVEDLASDLAEAERRKLNSNLDYLFEVERGSEVTVFLEGAKKTINVVQLALMFSPVDAALVTITNIFLNTLTTGADVVEMAVNNDQSTTMQAMTELMAYIGSVMIDIKSLGQLQGYGAQRLIKNVAHHSNNEPHAFGGIRAPIESEPIPHPPRESAESVVFVGEETPDAAPVVKGGVISRARGNAGTSQVKEPLPARWSIKDNGDFDPCIKYEETQELHVKEVRNELFGGELHSFNVVQQFTLEGNIYQTGYIETDSIKIHLIVCKGSSLEKNGASTLIVTAHGLHQFGEAGASIATLPPGVDLSLYVPYGYFLKDPVLGRLALSHERMKPAILLSEKLPNGFKSTVSQGATDKIQEIWDATGIIDGGTEPSKPIKFHNQKLLPYKQDSDYKIHASLKENVRSNKHNLIDVVSIKSETSVQSILDSSFIKKYKEVKSIACRVLRGPKNGAADIPFEAKERLCLRLGIPAKEFDKMAKEYDRLVARRDGSEMKAELVDLTSYPSINRRNRRDATEAEDGSYYYFTRIAAVVGRSVFPSGNASVENILGYIVGDEANNSLYVPIEANPRIELVSLASGV